MIISLAIYEYFYIIGPGCSTTNRLLKRRKKCQKKVKMTVMLARNLLSKLCASLVHYLDHIIRSDDFCARHRQSHKDFSRDRLLPFHNLIYLHMNFFKGSYQDELDRFFNTLYDLEIDERFVTKTAFCNARKKVKHEAFIELNHRMGQFFYESFSPLTWHGFNLIAIDGSTCRLPRTRTISDHFGVWAPQNGEPCPIARVSQMFDVLNRVTIDAIISPKEHGERELAAQHFINLFPTDLVLMDRGYYAYWLFNLILSLGAHFCARVPLNEWKIVKQFYNSGRKQKTISLPAPYCSVQKCTEMGLETKPLKLRLIRIELDNGETEILITSLIDRNAYPYELFSELYHERWPVEEDYKAMKHRLEVENFSTCAVRKPAYFQVINLSWRRV